MGKSQRFGELKLGIFNVNQFSTVYNQITSEISEENMEYNRKFKKRRMEYYCQAQALRGQVILMLQYKNQPKLKIIWGK